MHSKVHSFKSPSRSRIPPSSSHLGPFLSATSRPLSSPLLGGLRRDTRCDATRRDATRRALRSHDVTRAGITHTKENRCESAAVSGPARRREGRDSFEPRLVFASPCVPRTSYFNETVCLSLPLLSLPPPPRSFPLAVSLVNQPTGPLAPSLAFFPFPFVISLSHIAHFSPSRPSLPF